MDKKRIVVTGGHSYLGQKFIHHLTDSSDVQIEAIITPWAKETDLIRKPERLRYLKADLTSEPSTELLKALSEADHLVHFAWIRGSKLTEVLDANLKMVSYLIKHLREPGRFCFISSVAASPEAPGIYGRTKFLVAEKVLSEGGEVLVTGLIVADDPRGPYKLLVDFVKSLPLAVRVNPGTVKLYPVKVEDFVDGLTCLLDSPASPGSYRLFPRSAIDFNDFISRLETKFPRKRVKVRFNYGLILNSLKALRNLHLPPRSLPEKLLTFFYKDEKYLLSHKEIEGCGQLERPITQII